MPDHERFQITIRAEPGFKGDLLARLRAFLKVALRSYGIRCVEIRPEPREDAQDALRRDASENVTQEPCRRTKRESAR